MNTVPRLTLFYDGLNPPCTWEIGHYRKHLPGDSTRCIDIAEPSFDAAQHGLDPIAVQRVFHIKVGDEVRAGVDAFLTILDAIPRYRWLAWLGRTWLIHLILRIGYAGICVVRPWLSKHASAKRR